MKNIELEKEFIRLHDMIRPWDQRNEEEDYFINFWLDTVNKQYHEIEKRYFSVVRSREEIYSELRQIFDKKIVIPFADFGVNTVCSLACKNCIQLQPYFKKHEVFEATKLIGWLEQIFKFCDYIHIISPLGGEPFINKDLSKFIDYLYQKKQEGKIGFIRLVTNGTICPESSIIESLAREGIFVLVGNYENVLTDYHKKQRHELIEKFEKIGVKYTLAEPDFEWFDMGKCEERRNLTEEQIQRSFATCNFKNCAGIFEGKLYRCGKLYSLEQTVQMESNEVECIDFTKISRREELKNKLYQFYCAKKITGCLYCNLPEERVRIPVAEQLNREV